MEWTGPPTSGVRSTRNSSTLSTGPQVTMCHEWSPKVCKEFSSLESFRFIIFEFISRIDILRISCEIIIFKCISRIDILRSSCEIISFKFISRIDILRISCEIIIFKCISRIDILRIFRVIALRWMPQNTMDEKSTLVQIMAWCRQAPIHYLSQCCPTSM